MLGYLILLGALVLVIFALVFLGWLFFGPPILFNWDEQREWLKRLDRRHP